MIFQQSVISEAGAIISLTVVGVWGDIMVVSCIGPLLSIQMHNLYPIDEKNHTAIHITWFESQVFGYSDWLGSHFEECINYWAIPDGLWEIPQLSHSYGSHCIGRLPKEREILFSLYPTRRGALVHDSKMFAIAVEYISLDRLLHSPVDRELLNLTSQCSHHGTFCYFPLLHVAFTIFDNMTVLFMLCIWESISCARYSNPLLISNPQTDL